MAGVFQKTIRIAIATCLATIIFANSGRAEAPVSLAVFDFELVDTSYEGEKSGVNADETRRLALIGALLRERLKESGRYTLVDMAPAAAKIKNAGIIHSCNGCDADIARSLRAAFAVTGKVQKVSNLILNINVYVRDAATGKLATAMSADIRGNTDQSWTHGIKWLVRRRFLKWQP